MIRVSLVLLGALLFGAGQPGLLAQSSQATATKGRPALIAQLGHNDAVQQAVLNDDKQWLLTGARDGTARLWDVSTGREMRVFRGHSEGVTSLAISRDNKRLVTGSWDGTAKCWDLQTGKEIQAFQGHRSSVLSVALAPDGKSLISGGSDGIIRVWDLLGGKQQRVFAVGGSLRSIAISSDGKFLVAGTTDNLVCILDTNSGNLIRRFVHRPAAQEGQGQALKVQYCPVRVALSSDGTMLATTGGNIFRLWDFKTGKEIRTFSQGIGPCCVAFSDDNKWLAVCGNEGVQVRDTKSGHKVCSVNGVREILSVSFSRDGKWLVTASADGGAALWEMGSGKKVRVFEGRASIVHSVALLKKQGKLIVANADYARIWRLDSGQPVQTLAGHKQSIWSLSASRDGRWLVTGSLDNTARLWDTASGKAVRVFRGSAQSYRTLRGNRKETTYFEGREEQIVLTQLSGDGKWLITGSMVGVCRFWEVATGKEIRVFDGPFGQGSRSQAALNGDGKLMAVFVGSVGGVVNLSESSSGKKLLAFPGHQDHVTSIAFSPDEKLLVTAEKTARLWDLASGRQLRVFEGHQSEISCLALSEDGKWLITGGFDQTARLWDVRTGKTVWILTGHAGTVLSVAIDGIGKCAITTGQDGTTRFWDLKTGKECCSLINFADGSWAVFDAEGRYDASNNGDVDGLCWVVENRTFPLRQFRDDYYDCGLLGKYTGHHREPLRKLTALMR